MLKFGAIFLASFRRFVLAMFWSTGLKSSCLWLGLLLAFTDAASDDEFGEEGSWGSNSNKALPNFNITISNKYVLYLYMTLL
jgi:hypothetical protein